MSRRLFRIVQYSILLFIVARITAAQEPSDWEGFPSLSGVNDVTVLNGYIYAASSGGMFRYDIENQEYKLYYRDHGLDKDGVRTLVNANGMLYLGFDKDGLIRFDPETETFTEILFPEYVNQAEPLKTVALNDILVYSDTVLLVAHENGIDMLDLETESIRTFSKLSVNITQDTPVNHVYVLNGKIWACTPEGLAWADIDNPNLESESQWDSIDFGDGVRALIPTVIDGVTIFYVGTDARYGIKTFNPETLTIEDADIETGAITDFAETPQNIYAIGKAGYFKNTGKYWFGTSKYTDLNAIVAYDSKIFIGAGYDGLLCVVSSGYWGIPSMNLPKSASIRHIDVTDDGVIWTSTAERDNDDHSFLQKFHDGKWVFYDIEEGDEIPSKHTTSAFQSSHGPVWASTWDRGLYVLHDNGTPDKDDDLIMRVDESEEILERTYGSYVVCPQVKEDLNGNIWVAFYSLGAYVLEGELPATEYKYQHFEIDDNEFVISITPDIDGWVWLGMNEPHVYGIYVGDDPFDTSDDVTRHITKSDGILGERIRAIHPDQDGDVWVGSEGGLNRIVKMSGRTLDVENENTLLGDDSITVLSIEVDPYNTKWIGTSRGLVKISAGNEYITTYTTDNSPILSNMVYSLKYDEGNDQLLIGTDTGLSRLTVVKKDNDNNEASAFHMYPNPFEIWGYDSKAVFTDLKPGKPVSIYTFNGELVTEIEPGNYGSDNGTDAVWNGRNLKQEYVGSGVYFFTGVDQNGEDFKEKFVVIRR